MRAIILLASSISSKEKLVYGNKKVFSQACKNIAVCVGVSGSPIRDTLKPSLGARSAVPDG